MPKKIFSLFLCLFLAAACHPGESSATTSLPGTLSPSQTPSSISPILTPTETLGVSIYLAQTDVKADPLAGLALAEIPIESQPLIAMDEILAYSKDTNEMTLTFASV